MFMQRLIFSQLPITVNVLDISDLPCLIKQFDSNNMSFIGSNLRDKNKHWPENTKRAKNIEEVEYTSRSRQINSPALQPNLCWKTGSSTSVFESTQGPKSGPAFFAIL